MTHTSLSPRVHISQVVITSFTFLCVTDVTAAAELSTQIHAWALNPHTHSAAFKSPRQVIYLNNYPCFFPRWVTRHFHPPVGAILVLLLASRDEKPKLETSWPLGENFSYYDRGGIRLQLVSFQRDVPVLQFTFFCCVVILATLISVLHFILTSKGNMLVKFHWISGPFPDHPVSSVLFGTSHPLWLLQSYKREQEPLNITEPQNTI